MYLYTVGRGVFDKAQIPVLAAEEDMGAWASGAGRCRAGQADAIRRVSAVDFSFTERQQNLKDEVASFVDGLDRGEIEAFERRSEFPREIYSEMGARGWVGAMVPPEYGGLGYGAVEMAILTEELGRIGLAALTLSLHGERTLLSLGTDAQKAQYLPRLSTAEVLSAIVVSEPEVGSSMKQMKTRAVRDGDDYVINGRKTNITLGREADLMITFVMTEAGLTVLLVDGDTPGISCRKLDAVGWRLEPHYEIDFTECRVPASALLGQEGRGLDVFFATFDLTRICNASHLIGIARSALDSAIPYATERQVGSSKVADFQGIQWIIAELATKLETASLMRFKAAWMEDQGVKHVRETAMTKLVAMDLANDAANRAFSIVGGYGGYRTAPFERYLRDAKIGLVTGGSAEVMKNTIARETLRDYGYRPPK